MKRTLGALLKVLKWILIILIAAIIVFLVIRFIGQKNNSRTSKGGINEEMYVDINNTKQWISIYGQDKDNPVLLYLHGGPGSATSAYDYAFTRKWSDVYTVVTWDQRNCGKSYSSDQNDTVLTYDLMMSDGVEMTKYLLDYLGKDKITLLGHSWGTYFGSNLVLAYPEYYDCYIGTGQLVDMYENEVAFQKAASEWAGDDEEGLELLKEITPEHLTEEHFINRNLLMEKYGYGLMRDGTDYNMLAAEIFNPYYNVNGDNDYQTNYLIAQDYFNMSAKVSNSLRTSIGFAICPFIPASIARLLSSSNALAVIAIIGIPAIFGSVNVRIAFVAS